MAEESILNILRELVALKSKTGTNSENLASDYIYEFIRTLEYFKKNPENCNLVPIPNDPFSRHLPYAFIEGKSKNTVILTGHFDVVDEFDYGDIKELAYELGNKLEKRLMENEMTSSQREDMKSGQWIWGKGAADMKGGLAIHLDLLKEYAEAALKGTLEGNVLFMPVADEESYSGGMRFGVRLLAKLKRERNLEYKLLINPEPTDVVEGKQIMYLGSVGKLMPVIMVQGVSSHIGHCFDGFNPLDILSGIYMKTNGALSFVDQYEKEATMPPTWLKMRDLKDTYDVSIPLRAAGYFTVLSLYSSPEETLNKIINLSKNVASEMKEKNENNYEKYKKLNQFEIKPEIEFHIDVYDFHSLKTELEKKHGETFKLFYEKLTKTIENKIKKGIVNYPDGTVELMDQLLEFANFREPVVLIGFAPPFYPSINSNRIPGKTDFAKKAYEIVKSESKKRGVELDYQNYFMGISDNSYSGVDENAGNLEIVKEETPLWGRSYDIDFKAIAEVNVPAILYGPIGKEYHKWSERVEKKSLLYVVPAVTRELIKQAWKF